MNSRVYNFSAGPSMLPEPVLKRAADEMLNYQGSGQCVMEMSHRSKVFGDIIVGCEELLRKVLGIPSNYKVLFMQGGASSQFAMIPLNLLNGSGKADFILTGQWSNKAYKEASRYGAARVVATGKDKNFTYVPKTAAADFDQDADYAYICFNETIGGVKYPSIPDTGKVPLVADVSSCILSEPLDVSKFGLIFAGAQKNMGPAGLTTVIVREDLLGHARDVTPTMMNYATQSENNSLYNTPPCYAIYICKLVLEWLEGLGGLDAMAAINRKKAGMLYDFLDNSKLFHGTVPPEFRSMMNIPFVTGSDELDKKAVAAAEKEGFINIKGHRSVGGLRASIYNAMPVEGVEKLVDFLTRFEKANA